MISTIVDSGSFWGAVIGLGVAILGAGLSLAAKLGRLSQSINDFRERQNNATAQLSDTLDVIDRRLTYLEHRAWTTHPLSPGPVGPEPGPRPRPR